MYKVYCDEYLIHSDSIDSLKLYSSKVSQELNKVGSFTFTIYPNHPYFDRLQKLKSIITVYQDDYILFRGRIINDINGFHNEKQVTCESELAFLIDSIQRPYEFSGTPEQLFAQLIMNHNSQVDEEHQFKVGNVTVKDSNDYIARSDSEYLNTWKSLEDKLFGTSLGGYIWVRHEEDGNYIDYLEDFNVLAAQKIEFSKNLLDIKRTVKAEDIFTVIVPIGADITDAEGNKTGVTTISSVNDGKDYIESAEGILLYGRIVKMVQWSEVTVPSNLKRKAEQYLSESILLSNCIELTAADLSGTNQNITAFHLGTKVQLISKPHELNRTFLINKISIDLLNPANNKLSLDTTYSSMTDYQQNSTMNIVSTVTQKVEQSKADVVAVVTEQMTSQIESSAQQISASISNNYYLKSETDALVESKVSSVKQTVDGWDFTFEEMKKDIQAVANNSDAQFENISRYIRFIDGKIILGEVGNELELNIANDRIQFLQNNSEVAYFSNNKLFVTDGEYTNSLQLGKFAFTSRSNGNLSFRKVRE